MQSNLSLTKIFSISSIESYNNAIKNISILTPEEEYSLAKELKDNDSIEAAQSLILSHLRFVLHIAKGYSGYGLPQADLIQEGNIGLMKAVKKFDPDKGVRLVSFAVHWIKAEIHEFVLKNWRIVKIATTKAQRKLFFNLRKNKVDSSWFNPEQTKELANSLNVTEQDVKQMESRMSFSDQTFDLKDNEDDDFSPSEFLIDHGSNTENNILDTDSTMKEENALKRAIMQLNERDKDIITQRWLTEEKATLGDLAVKHNVSAERIRQLEKNAMKKMKNVL